MKKFIAVSIVLLLIGASAFGYSLYHYIDVSSDKGRSTADQASANIDLAETQPQDSGDSKTQLLTDTGIFSQNYDKAYDDVSKMTTEQMAGQIIIGVCKNDETAAADISKYGLGGYLYESEKFDYLSVDEVKSLISSYGQNAKIPMIMAAKEEGGNVNSISDHDAFNEYNFDSPRNLYAEGGLEAVKNVEQQKADLLSSIGINLNMAPVLDMAEEFNQIMYSRSLGADLLGTCQYAETVTEISQSKGVSVALKHFPGYGTILDTTEPVVEDTRTYSEIENNDIKPFKSGIDSGAHVVMVSNVVVQNIDSAHTAALSADVHKILRDNLMFTGLIITDNLDNADYSAYADGKDVAVAAVLAGNDMILVSDYESAYMSIVSAVNEGIIDTQTLQKACTRVLAYKYTAGIIK